MADVDGTEPHKPQFASAPEQARKAATVEATVITSLPCSPGVKCT